MCALACTDSLLLKGQGLDLEDVSDDNNGDESVSDNTLDDTNKTNLIYICKF